MDTAPVKIVVRLSSFLLCPEFTVKTYDSNSGKSLKKTWTNNMQSNTKAVIAETKGIDFTSVTFKVCNHLTLPISHPARTFPPLAHNNTSRKANGCVNSVSR